MKKIVVSIVLYKTKIEDIDNLLPNLINDPLVSNIIVVDNSQYHL